MSFWQSVLAFLDTSMEIPQPYGWFHLMFFTLSLLAIIPLCLIPKNPSKDHVRRVVFVTALVVIILEIYKQINFEF